MIAISCEYGQELIGMYQHNTHHTDYLAVTNLDFIK